MRVFILKRLILQIFHLIPNVFVVYWLYIITMMWGGGGGQEGDWFDGKYCNIFTVFHCGTFWIWLVYIVWIIIITIGKLYFILLFKLSQGHRVFTVLCMFSLAHTCVYFIQFTLIYFLPIMLFGNFSNHTEDLKSVYKQNLHPRAFSVHTAYKYQYWFGSVYHHQLSVSFHTPFCTHRTTQNYIKFY
jgi:hypothetical protein